MTWSGVHDKPQATRGQPSSRHTPCAVSGIMYLPPADGTQRTAHGVRLLPLHDGDALETMQRHDASIPNQQPLQER
jgi:hypothetical protein